ncbi:MAG: phosphoglucosamine mutase [Sulfolobales archaeon]
MERLFGTDGVRGVFNAEMDPFMAMRLAFSIATYLPKGSRVLVARDGRAGSENIYYAVIAGLMAGGVKVYDGGPAPTPSMQLSVRDRGYDAGVMVTASHNPPEYVGVKFITGDGVEAPREVEEEIEKIYHETRFRKVSWREVQYSVSKDPLVNEYYISKIVESVDKEKIASRGFRVVVDPANSVGGLTTPYILERLGVKVYTINAELRPEPTRPYEPTPDTITDLRAFVKELKADLGVAHDGDADRAMFVDEEGEAYWGDRDAVLLAKHIYFNRRSKMPKRVVTAVSSSTLVEEMLKPYGIEVVWTKVGSIVIARELIRIGGGLCGFEENTGFIYPEHQYVRDGGMKTALILEYLAYEKRSLRELMSELPKLHVIKTKRPTNPEKTRRVLDELKKIYSNERLITVDGVKVIGEDYWFLVRPSGTEPILRIMIEAKTRDKAEEVLKEILSVVDRL